MQQIARTALKLETSYPGRMVTTQPAQGITEIKNSYTDNTVSIDVVMRNFPGSLKPNPTDVLAVDLQSNVNPANKTGITSDNEVLYAAPGSTHYLSTSIAGGIYNVDNKGWTAIASHENAMDGVVSTVLSGAIDTADSRHYAVDASGNTVGPIQTAEDTIQFAETFRPIVASAISRGDA